MFAMSYLRGQAQHYVKPLLTQYLDDGSNPKEVFANYGRFKVYLESIFGISNEES